MSIAIVSFREEHLDSTLALMQKMGCDPTLDREWLCYRTFEDHTCASDLLLVAQDGENVVGYAFGCVRKEGGVVKKLGVDETYRRRGLGTRLLNRLEEAFAKRGLEAAVVGGVGPNYFAPGVELRDTDMIAFLYKQGYQTDREARVDMVVDLREVDLSTNEAEARLAEKGLQILRASAADLEPAKAFVGEHFSEGWLAEVNDTGRYDRPSLHLAKDGDEIVAFAAYGITGPHRFGPTGTNPDYRRKGIGTILLKRCLRDIAQLGYYRAEISWAGPIGYYAQAVGARIHKAYWVFGKELSPQ